MKYAYVLVHHIGDDNVEVTEGRILHVSNERFNDLGHLVREATADEVKEGFVPKFEKDTTTAPDAPAPEGGEKQKPAPQNKKAPEPSNKAN